MVIIPVNELREGMQLAENVDTTTATEYRTILQKGIFLSGSMIEMLKSEGIKSVKINIGGLTSGVDTSNVTLNTPTHTAPPVSDKRISTHEQQINEDLSRALADMDEIFECSEEIKELSQASIQKVDNIANDIITDIASDPSFLSKQMIALQNYDDYTYKHCLRVAMLSASVGVEMGLSVDEIRDLVVAGLLHDIGKSNIDHDIIIKPGKLTDEEFSEIKRHPLIGYNILKNSGKYNANVLSGVLFHQEKFDGSGYPTGISGKKIPLIARIITVCDVFDALTSNRPYRMPWSVPETEEYILGACDVHFDLEVTQAFLRAFNPYPIGTMVQLSDGRHGVIVSHSANVLRPKVRIMDDYCPGEEIDLMDDFRFLTLSVTGIYKGNEYPVQ